MPAPYTVQGGHGFPIGPYSFSAKAPAAPGKGAGPFTVQGGHGFSIGPYSFSAKTPATGVSLIAQARSIARFTHSRIFGRVN